MSSPSHSVTYVTVEDDDDDAVVFATTMAFTGMMVAWGCAVWGTGYYYPPYWGYGGGYPYYYPHYPTYGYGASYNPWTGAYTRGAVAYGPYGGAGVAQRYNPRTGTYSRGAVAHGPYGSRGAASAYNPRTGTSAATRQGSSVYGSWGQTGVARGDDWAKTTRVTNNVTGNTTRVTKTSSGDVYAGRDGNVYRKDGDSYQKYDEWQLEQRRSGDAGAATAGSGSREAGRHASERPRDRVRDGFDHAPASDSRFRGARRGRAAHARLGPGAERRIAEVRQLPRERRAGRWGRAAALNDSAALGNSDQRG